MMNTLLPLGLLGASLLAAPAALDHPTQTPGDIVEVAADAGSFGTLLAAAKAAGLVDALKSDGPLTVFAPTDEAFAKLPNGVVQDLLKPENKQALANILTYHVIAGEVDAIGALRAKSADALNGDKLEFGLVGGQLKVNGNVSIVATDVDASNGIIHVIDQVLIPTPKKAPAPEGRLVIGFYSERPGDELANYLGVDRNACLLVSQVTDGGEAANAGLQPFDLIVAVNDRAATKEGVAEIKEEVGFEGEVTLDILRRGKQMRIHSKVGIETH